MFTIIRESIVVAKKNHVCDASKAIMFHLSDIREFEKLTFNEWRLIAQQKANKCIIPKGKKYLTAFCRNEDSAYTWKSLPEMDAIYQKLKLYQ